MRAGIEVLHRTATKSVPVMQTAVSCAAGVLQPTNLHADADPPAEAFLLLTSSCSSLQLIDDDDEL